MEGILVNGADATMSLQGKGQANRSRHSANFCTGIRFLTFVLNLSQIKLRFCFLCECLSFTSETQPPMSLHFLVMLSTICGDVPCRAVPGSGGSVPRQIFPGHALMIRAVPSISGPCPFDLCRPKSFRAVTNISVPCRARNPS